jgi:hypothetical protein
MRTSQLKSEVQYVSDGAAVRPDALPLSPEDFAAALDELSAGSERLPILPPEAYSREGIYDNG